MPRTARAEPTTVSELTDDERSDLTILFAQKITAAQAKVDLAMAAVKVERDEVNSLFASVKAELRYTRKEFEEFLEARKKSDAEYMVAENKRRRLFADGGLQVGQQLALDFGTEDTADEIARARKRGARDYHAGILPTEPPKELHPLMQPHWMEGWQEEQRKTAEAMGRGEALLAKRGEPTPPEPDEPDLNAGGDDATVKADEPPPPADLGKVRAARRAKFDEKHPEPAHA